MPIVTYQRMLQSCRHAIIDEGDLTEEMPEIEEHDPEGIIQSVRLLQQWIKQASDRAEFQAYYQIGRAMNINQTRTQQRKPITALSLTPREKTIATRIYLLFRDHIGALGHIKGIKVENMRSLTQREFDDLLHTLEGEYPPFIDFGEEPLIWIDATGDDELELEEWDL